MADRRVSRGRLRSLAVTFLAATVVAFASPASSTVAATPPIVVPVRMDPVAGERPVLTAGVARALQTRLEAVRAKYAMPGVSVAIIFPDGRTWTGTDGIADIDAEIPVTPETAFAIASISKTFTAALVMALVQDGLVALDAPVRTYLPDLKVDRRITVRQLLDHTSGLRDYFLDPRIDKALLKDTARRWDEVDALTYMGKPYFKPGRGWHYSNTNYLLLGMLAETVGGAPLADQLRIRFLDPLGLSRTYYQPTEAPHGPVATGYRFASASTEARAVDLSDGTPIVPFTSVVTAAAGAGGMAASAGDIARWARALYEGDALAATTVGTMLGDVALTGRYRPSVPYGLGVQASEIVGRPALGHSGRLLGFRSVVRWLPEEGLAIAVLTNQSRTDPGVVARALLRIALRSAPSCACKGVR